MISRDLWQSFIVREKQILVNANDIYTEMASDRFTDQPGAEKYKNICDQLVNKLNWSADTL